MFQVRSWPTAILHLDADAFFASVIQAVKPQLKGKPVVVGKERGIATAFSYEAKKLGVRRGMTFSQIKKTCPQAIFIDSDYEIYSLFSQKMFTIIRSFFPMVEQYSVDEGFVDLKGLKRPLNSSYQQMAKAVKEKIENSLGITVSVGVSLTKSLAKLASSSRKPSGLTLVDGLNIENFLAKIPVQDVWGIGENTAAYLRKNDIQTALDFTSQKEIFIEQHLTKPFLEIWDELRGNQIYNLNPYPKESYKGMSKSQTFYPATNNVHIVWAQLLNNIESVFKRARMFNYRVGKIFIFLKTQQFNYQVRSIKLLEKTCFPLLIREQLKQAFSQIYQRNTLYRATGCHLTDLEEQTTWQPSLFTDRVAEEKAKRLYSIWETKKVDFGTSLLNPQHQEEKKPIFRTRMPLLLINNF
ncbi:MAG TPA: DNA polymerase IV [Candidatus Bathyarchaeia archaeon]|nr:DNA polymerase IV [Candidatus Bathyarchaeia archaeon]